MSSTGQGPSQATVIRQQVAKVVVGLTIAFAVILVLGAIIIAFGDSINRDNSIVSLILNLSEIVDGPFSRDGGFFNFSGEHAETKEALANWGLGAVVWVVVGQALSRLIGR